jgi:peptidoglycan hydrolase-like protein with peptidoglycan-binding domain
LPQTPVSSCLQGIMTTPTTPASFSFSRNLHLWDQGPDVTALQTFLISEASGPAAAKLQAHGTSQVFGLLTYNALREFQASVGIRATGYFGPLTRAYITAHE